MNERIRELAGQACDIMPLYDSINRGDYTHSQYNMQIELLLEKFAELLIRDVTETATKYRQSKTRPVGWNFGHTVLDHYGLKENDSPNK